VNYRFTPVHIGKSAATVYRLTAPEAPALFLKVAAENDRAELEAERERLLWLKSKTEVPNIRGFAKRDGLALLLTDALRGVNGAEVPRKLWLGVVAELANELRKMHSSPSLDGAFDRGLRIVIDIARARTAAGVVDESDFDDERRGLRAQDLLIMLERNRPQTEERVITHGDACLPNAIFDDGRFSGFVDCGRSGLADRYQDLALASRSIESNYGLEYAEAFFAAYGLASVDRKKLAYYRLVDEFF
jgi:aminoglycoside 3'-phosphotransferase-2